LLGLTRQDVGYHLRQYRDFKSNEKNLFITLNVFNSSRPVAFHPFSALTYVAYRSTSPEAIEYRDYLEVALNEKFNKDNGFKKTEQQKPLEKNVREIIQYLKNKVWEEATLAFEAKTTQDFNNHMDLADKYAMDVNKRERQLRNAINCNKRLEKESELNRQGVLTESGNDKVFIPTTQSRLTDFSNNSIEGKNKRRLL
jgi:hypothetical protein